MSVYNSEDYLSGAIDSVLNQSFEDFEFVIIDDGSKDRSKEIIRRYAEADSRIVFVENARNLGLAAALNKGISLCQGTYIARQDADDYSSPDRLKVQLDYALSAPHLDVIGCDCFNIDIDGQIIYQDSSYSGIRNFRKALLNRRAIFPHGSAFLKKSALLSAGMYDTRFYYVQDAELWLRLIDSGANIAVLDKPMYYYRVTPVENAKRIQAKNLYNNVLKLVYEQKAAGEVVDRELANIQAYLKDNKPVLRKYYMADYWKGLGNTAYVNDRGPGVSTRYIRRAVAENNPLSNYGKYLLLVLVYLIPPHIARLFLRSLDSSYSG